MPRLRGLHHPGDGAELPRRAWRGATEPRVYLGHRLLEPLSLLHEHLRRALDPRQGTCGRHRYRHRQSRPACVGHHRRRRRAVDWRQPHDPHPAPQRQPEDSPVQQPDLWADQGPILADIRAGKGDQVVADGVAGLPVQPGEPCARRRGVIRGEDDRHGQEAHHIGARGCLEPQRHRIHRDLPELQRVQRQGLRGAHRQGDQGREPDLPGTRQADPLRAKRRIRGHARKARRRGGRRCRRRDGHHPHPQRRGPGSKRSLCAEPDFPRPAWAHAYRRIPQGGAAGL